MANNVYTYISFEGISDKASDFLTSIEESDVIFIADLFLEDYGGGAGTVATTTDAGSPGYHTPTFGRARAGGLKKPKKRKAENADFKFTY